MRYTKERKLTQHQTGITLDSREDLWFLDTPSSDIGEDLITDRSLLGSSRDSPAGLGDLLLELLNKRSV